LLTRSGNQVGALFYGEDVDTMIPARSGRRHVLRILHSMLERPTPKRNQPTDLRAPLTRAAHLMKRRSMVFVVSDFISVPGWQGRLGQLAQRHEIVAVRLH